MGKIIILYFDDILFLSSVVPIQKFKAKILTLTEDLITS